MTEVAFNAPGQYGYGRGVPAPPVPQQVQVEDLPTNVSAGPVTPSYDVAPAPLHASDSAVPVHEAAPVTASSGRVAVQVVDRMRSTAERGSTTVPTEVVEKIVAVAVREVPGVYEFGTPAGGAAIDDGDADAHRSIAIDLDGRTVGVEIRLVIEYGFPVFTVTDKVRTKVITSLENLFSYDVTGVDITIVDIHIEPTDSDEEPQDSD